MVIAPETEIRRKVGDLQRGPIDLIMEATPSFSASWTGIVTLGRRASITLTPKVTNSCYEMQTI
jgi:hypothetical protein